MLRCPWIRKVGNGRRALFHTGDGVAGGKTPVNQQFLPGEPSSFALERPACKRLVTRALAVGSRLDERDRVCPPEQRFHLRRALEAADLACEREMRTVRTGFRRQAAVRERRAELLDDRGQRGRHVARRETQHPWLPPVLETIEREGEWGARDFDGHRPDVVQALL